VKKQKFPNLLHVTTEKDGDDVFYVAHNNGVMGLDEPQPVAIYQLVKTGEVQIHRRFVENSKK